MDMVRTEIAWLTSGEVENAVRDYVRVKGLNVTRHAQVNGLGKLSEAKHAVSVQLSSKNEEVK